MIFFCFYPFNVCEEPTRNQTARLESYSRMRSTSSTVMNANAHPHRPKTGEAKNRTSRYLKVEVWKFFWPYVPQAAFI